LAEARMRFEVTIIEVKVATESVTFKLPSALMADPPGP
ncbi:MAG: hypothetical protein FD149_2422, partial [Rhodospirillaceae bacterium]